MSDTDEKINRLTARLDKMVEYQDYFYREINSIRDEITALKQSSAQAAADDISPVENHIAEEKVFSKPPIADVLQPKTFEKQENRAREKSYQPPISNQTESRASFVSKSNLEEFVGRNLISLIGIIILVLGVGIGAKYAIDRDLISPLARIVLGLSLIHI